MQLDVIERGVELYTNPGEVVLTPFMGVGSEVYGSVLCDRKGIGCELKTAYYSQAVKNMDLLIKEKSEQKTKQVLFEEDESEALEEQLSFRM